MGAMDTLRRLHAQLIDCLQLQVQCTMHSQACHGRMEAAKPQLCHHSTFASMLHHYEPAALDDLPDEHLEKSCHKNAAAQSFRPVPTS